MFSFNFVNKHVDNPVEEDQKDEIYETTPLHTAVCNGHEKIVESLLLDGAKIEAKDHDERTPLFLAVKYNKMKIVELLLKHGANVNTTPLHLAIDQKFKHIAEVLLLNGANINAKNCMGLTPIHLATEANNIEMVNFLIKKKANINETAHYGYHATSLHIAASFGFESMAKLLI